MRSQAAGPAAPPPSPGATVRPVLARRLARLFDRTLFCLSCSATGQATVFLFLRPQMRPPPAPVVGGVGSGPVAAAEPAGSRCCPRRSRVSARGGSAGRRVPLRAGPSCPASQAVWLDCQPGGLITDRMQTIRTIFKNNTNNIQNNIHNIVAILLISLQYKQYCWNHCFDINNMLTIDTIVTIF